MTLPSASECLLPFQLRQFSISKCPLPTPHPLQKNDALGKLTELKALPCHSINSLGSPDSCVGRVVLSHIPHLPPWSSLPGPSGTLPWCWVGPCGSGLCSVAPLHGVCGGKGGEPLYGTRSREAEGRLEEPLPPWPTPTSCRCPLERPLTPPCLMIAVGGRAGDGLLLKPNSLVVGLDRAGDGKAPGGDHSPLGGSGSALLGQCRFIPFHGQGGRALLEARCAQLQSCTDQGLQSRAQPSSGPMADRRGSSQSLLGGGERGGVLGACLRTSV